MNKFSGGFVGCEISEDKAFMEGYLPDAGTRSYIEQRYKKFYTNIINDCVKMLEELTEYKNSNAELLASFYTERKEQAENNMKYVEERLIGYQ